MVSHRVSLVLLHYFLLCTIWIGTSGNHEVESFLNEANVMKHLSAQRCDYIIQLVGIQMGQAPAMIAMELAPCGNFLNILKSSWMMARDAHSSMKVTSGGMMILKCSIVVYMYWLQSEDLIYDHVKWICYCTG